MPPEAMARAGPGMRLRRRQLESELEGAAEYEDMDAHELTQLYRKAFDGKAPRQKAALIKALRDHDAQAAAAAAAPAAPAKRGPGRPPGKGKKKKAPAPAAKRGPGRPPGRKKKKAAPKTDRATRSSAGAGPSTSRELRPKRKRTSYDETPQNLDAAMVGKVVAKTSEKGELLGFIVSVDPEVELAELHWNDGTVATVFAAEVKRQLVDPHTLVGRKILVPSGMVGEFFGEDAAYEQDQPCEILGYDAANEAFEVVMDSGGRTGTVPHRRLGPFLNMGSAEAPVNPHATAQHEKVDWQLEDEIELSLFCHGLDNQTAELKVPKWATGGQAKKLLSEQTGGALPVNMIRLEVFSASEGKMVEIEDSVPISEYGLDNQDDVNYVTLFIRDAPRSTEFEKQRKQYNKLIGQFKAAAREMREARSRKKKMRTRPKDKGSGIWGGTASTRKKTNRWTENEIVALLDGMDDFYQKHEGKTGEMPKYALYVHILDSSDLLDERTVDDVKVKIKNLQKAASKEQSAMRNPMSEETFLRIREVLGAG